MKRNMAGEIAAAGERGSTEMLIRGGGRGGISPFERVTDHGR
jgi:hypothetical protein